MENHLSQISFFEMTPFLPEKKGRGRGSKINQFLTVRKEGLNISGSLDLFLGCPEYVSVAINGESGVFGIKKVAGNHKYAVPVDRNVHGGRGRSVRINRKMLSEIVHDTHNFDWNKNNLLLTEYTINNDGYLCFELAKGIEVERRNQ